MLYQLFWREESVDLANKLEELQSAIINNDLKKAESLIGDPKVDLNRCVDTSKATPLYIATLTGNLKVIWLILMQERVDVNIAAKHHLKDFPLNLAINEQHYTMTALLCLHGAKFDSLPLEKGGRFVASEEFARYLDELKRLVLLEVEANSCLSKNQLKLAKEKYSTIIAKYNNFLEKYAQKFQKEHEEFADKFEFDKKGESFSVKMINKKIKLFQKAQLECDPIGSIASTDKSQQSYRLVRRNKTGLSYYLGGFFPSRDNRNRGSLIEQDARREDFLVQQYM